VRSLFFFVLGKILFLNFVRIVVVAWRIKVSEVRNLWFRRNVCFTLTTPEIHINSSIFLAILEGILDSLPINTDIDLSCEGLLLFLLLNIRLLLLFVLLLRRHIS
jgi:hypothetical protein